MAVALPDELADVLCEGLVVVFVLEHATATTIPRTRATTMKSFERLTRLLLLLWGHTGPAFLTFPGVGDGTRPRGTARAMNRPSTLPTVAAVAGTKVSSPRTLCELSVPSGTVRPKRPRRAPTWHGGMQLNLM